MNHFKQNKSKIKAYINITTPLRHSMYNNDAQCPVSEVSEIFSSGLVVQAVTRRWSKKVSIFVKFSPLRLNINVVPWKAISRNPFVPHPLRFTVLLLQSLSTTKFYILNEWKMETKNNYKQSIKYAYKGNLVI